MTFVIAGLDPAIHHSTMSAWVYILASRPGGTLYVGVTSNLVRRVFEHREGLVEGFTRQYDVKTLVYYEQHATISTRHPAGKEHQALVARMEDRFDHVVESRLARSLPGYLRLMF